MGCIELGNSEYVCVCQNGDSHEFNKDKPCGKEIMYFTKITFV